MSVAEPQLPIAAPAPVRAAAWWEIAPPVVLVAMVLAAVLGSHIAHDHGNLTGLVCFGSHYASATRPPAGAIPCGAQGYDGQFFFLQARDPLLLHDATLHQFAGAGQTFRAQRLGYPLLAWLLSAGRASAIPFAMLAANVLVSLGLSGYLAAYARRRGWPTLWTLAIALAPGMLLPVLRDLSDPLSTACMIVAALSWQARRRLPATVALTLAVLTREVMVVVIAGFAAEAAARLWRTRGHRLARRAILAQSAPVLLIPTALFLIWHVYLTARFGGALGTSSAMFPLTNMVSEIRTAVRLESTWVAIWDSIYVLVMCGAVVLAVRSVRRRVTVMSATALALCVSVVIPEFGDFWSDTRLSAPLLAILLLDGLRRRDRAQIALGATAGAMMLLILPFA
jgi:branched-subunit amino acid transport protein